MKRSWLLLGLASVLLLMLTWRPVQAQATDYKYFDQTGHNVTGEFLKSYQSVADAALLFGYPITESITGKDGLTVQYFQRARLELHPELPEGQRVQLTLLGRATYVQKEQVNVFNPLACRQYPETGFPVCFAFLEFFDKYGGVAQFGYPISPFEFHDDLIVQYFEKTRLEWHPWMPEGQRVAPGDLGRIYFDKAGEDPALLNPVDPLDATTIPQVLTLQTRAFVWKAVTLPTDQQLVFIIVQDQKLKPVVDASGTVKVRWPSGTEETFSFTTNNNGVAIVSLSVNNQPYGSLVYIEVTVTWNNLAGATTTSFRIWY